MKITKRQLRRIIREVVEEDQTTIIAGETVTIAPKSDVSREAKAGRQRNIDRFRPDTHEIWSAKEGESPEDTVARLKHNSRGLPGYMRMYQDPETGEVYAHAKYNTF